MKDIPEFLHVEYVGTNLSDKSLLLFRRVNANEANSVILSAATYRELILAASDGRMSRGAADSCKEILQELFEECEGAVDAYFRIIKKRGEEGKNADI